MACSPNDTKNCTCRDWLELKDAVRSIADSYNNAYSKALRQNQMDQLPEIQVAWLKAIADYKEVATKPQVLACEASR